MSVTAGIDIGSTTTKCVILKNDQLLSWTLVPSGVRPAETAARIYQETVQKSNITNNSIDAVATTGYGRRLVDFGDMVITEIRAAALGARFFHADAHTIIDVGGQDTKVITIDEDGEVEDFTMNDKCAAGTGRFLEVLAQKLELSYEEFVSAALSSETMIQMNSTCAVFAESEVISLLARGIDKKDIAAAAHSSISERISAMVRRTGGKSPFLFTGGGARNNALKQALEESLNASTNVPEHPQIMVAAGAAFAALLKLEKHHA